MIVFASQLFIETRKVVLGIGILDMGNELTASTDDIHSSSQEITGCPPLCRVRISNGKVAAFEQMGNLVRVDFIIFGFASVDSLHVEGMAQGESNLVLGTEIGKPIPAEDAFDTDDDVFQERGDKFDQHLLIGIDIFMKLNISLLIEDANVHFSGVKIDSAIILVLLGIEIHQVASFG